MALLILLNGPPASGKSTIARHFVASRPLALDLDIDVVRGLLGAWIDTPTKAGLAARALAVAMAETHLSLGNDVIVPQFVGRVDFVEQLEAVAGSVGASFVEIALMLDRDAALAAFEARRDAPSTQAHLDAVALVDRSDRRDAIGEMYDAFVDVVEVRARTCRVDVVRGDIVETCHRFDEALVHALLRPRRQ